MAKTFYIADLHFGHKNGLFYDNRPFSDIEQHDKTLIERWNSAVGAEDTVWVLGDFSWYPASKTISILSQLNGTKRLIVGNHDNKLIKNKNVCALFAEIVDYKEIRLGSNNGVCCAITLFPASITSYTDGIICMVISTTTTTGM